MSCLSRDGFGEIETSCLEVLAAVCWLVFARGELLLFAEVIPRALARACVSSEGPLCLSGLRVDLSREAASAVSLPRGAEAAGPEAGGAEVTDIAVATVLSVSAVDALADVGSAVEAGGASGSKPHLQPP